MAEATTQITVTPKQLGKHLRSIRRKKGLSLSEVARGAGLSRRELVAYERGKVPIPENDLWVLAGSCGIDVAELMPTTTSSMELTVAASATSVSDTISQLRQGQEDAGITAYLHTLQKLQALPAGKRIPVKERELEEIATALGSTPRSIEQKLQDVLHVSPDEAERLRAMILVPPNGRGRPRALAASPSALAAAAAEAEAAAVAAAEAAAVIDEPLAAPIAATTLAEPVPVEALKAVEPVETEAPVVASEPLQVFPAAPAAFLDQPLDAPIDPVHGHNVDVFEELARLPEPVPLGDPSAPLPDLLAPPDPFATPFASPFVGVPAIGPPEGTVELVDSGMPDRATAGTGTGAIALAGWSAADAPPIDVALRQGSATWDLGEPPLVAKTAPAPDPMTSETGGWQPPAPEGTEAAPSRFWESTDDWTPPPDGAPSIDGEVVDTPPADPLALGEDTWAGAAWDPAPWSPPDAADTTTLDVNPSTTEEWPTEAAGGGSWDHRPDPAAVDSGFYVDWGTPETEAPPGLAMFADPAVVAPLEDPIADSAEVEPAPSEPEQDPIFTILGTATVDIEVPFVTEAELGTELEADAEARETANWDSWLQTVDTAESVESVDTAETDSTTTPELPATDESPEPELAPISWHADGPDDEVEPEGSVVTSDTDSAPWADDAAGVAGGFDDPDLDSGPVVEEFVTAGPDWQLGNALPLVEVRGEGGLVMRRADERWALADVTTTSDFVAEFEVDFRSGPGLGMLFRASTDDEGRMSGYSFDIDPIYDGGGYLVRQWQADRELWNPIARVSGDSPAVMYGTLLVRIEVVGEHLSAQVNGVEVLTVENLKQASADRGRDPASGDRIGVQAWSSSDLVIDTARVAAR
jgi:transcriptional regulator with XRE-family HTH domain